MATCLYDLRDKGSLVLVYCVFIEAEEVGSCNGLVTVYPIQTGAQSLGRWHPFVREGPTPKISACSHDVLKLSDNAIKRAKQLTMFQKKL